MNYFNLREFVASTSIFIFLVFLIELFRSSSTEEILLSMLTALMLYPAIYIISKALYKKYQEIKEDIEYRW